MAREDWNRPDEFGAKKGYKRIGIEISYDGTEYCGWQIQKNSNTVQGEILEAVKKLTDCNDITVCGSGRTDSGVHAMGQVAHIEVPEELKIPTEAYYKGLNTYLPKSIRIKKSFKVSSSFHARFSTMAREYRYFITDDSDNPFASKYVFSVKNLPEINLLNSYAKEIIGTHDFTSFTTSLDLSESKFRDIYFSDFSLINGMYGEKIICYKICGNAFLYHMIRSLVGTMLDLIFKGKTVHDFKNILNGKNSSLCSAVAPPYALYLWRISYDPNEFLWFEKVRHDN